MKARELHPCDGCGGPLLAPGIGCFNVVRVSTAMPNPNALRQHVGLTTLFGGNEALAQAFVGDAEIAVVLGDREPDLWERPLLCFECFTSMPLAVVLEAMRGRREAAEAKDPEPAAMNREGC